MAIWALAILAIVAQASSITGTLIRKNVASLTESEKWELHTILGKLQKDDSVSGFEKAVAHYHGEPSMCKDPKTNKPLACCVHGMPTFPQWHRLYVAQMEQALVNKGLDKIGVPYWDWTMPITELPSLAKPEKIKDPASEKIEDNAWHSSDIRMEDFTARTVREVDQRLYQTDPSGQKPIFWDMILDALEKDSYCDFEVHFEVAHNHIHYLVGGKNLYSMSTLEYSAFDPIFFLHHSNLDRIFLIWQKLQEKRGKPSNVSDCMKDLFSQALEPFDRASNPISLTKQYSKAEGLFSYDMLGYDYDDLTLNGKNIDELHKQLESRKTTKRAFAVFKLFGIGTSAEVKVKVCKGAEKSQSSKCQEAKSFFILGGKNEMPWQFQKPFYLDVSEAVESLNQSLDSPFHVVAEVVSVNGTSLGTEVLPPATVYVGPSVDRPSSRR